ncbi:MAG: flagellar assembly lytic transglycosylase [Spirochaetia bacterium]
MRAHGSRYLRIELLIALIALPLLTAGCGAREVWGVPEDELRAGLARADYQVLAPVDFASQDPADALSLSPEAPYYLSFIFDSIARPSQGLRMLELAWSRSPSPWKEEAGLLLGQRYLSQNSYDKAIAVTRRLLSSHSADVEQRARRILVEGLYWNKDDAAVLQEAARLQSWDPEVLLFRAVSSLRLQLPSAHDLVMQLFIREKVSPLHGRVYTFLTAAPEFLQLFSAQERELLAAKNAFMQGDWDGGLPLMEDVLAGIDPSRAADGALVVDLGNSYISAGRQAAGAKFMETLAARFTGQARVDAREQAGRLYRRSRDFTRALSNFKAVAAEAPVAAQRERAQRYVLDVLLEMNPSDLVFQVESEAASWRDPSAFSSLLEDKIADFVTAKDWKTLIGLWRVLDKTGPDDVRAQLSYILARAWQEGDLARLPGAPPVSARELFLDAARRNPAGYYGILSSSFLGELPDRAVPAAPPEEQNAAAVLDPIVSGFFPFGLTDQAYSRLWAARDSLSDAQLLEAARRFSRAGDNRSSMYLVGALARRRKLTLVELQLYYPKAFGNFIEPLAAGAGIPDHILYGLVREESYFDADIVSSAGAVGLSQLMPATAASVAVRMRLADPDLRDPETNLTIGARHLKDLLSNVDSPTKALISYNAGLTRLRQWERAAKGFSSDLFVESLPIAETRQYVRKILVSAVMYAFLYRDADPREAALSFFGIQKAPLEPEAAPRPGAPARPN